jgi:hypothetical protein
MSHGIGLKIVLHFSIPAPGHHFSSHCVLCVAFLPRLRCPGLGTCTPRQHSLVQLPASQQKRLMCRGVGNLCSASAEADRGEAAVLWNGRVQWRAARE